MDKPRRVLYAADGIRPIHQLYLQRHLLFGGDQPPDIDNQTLGIALLVAKGKGRQAMILYHLQWYRRRNLRRRLLRAEGGAKRQQQQPTRGRLQQPRHKDLQLAFAEISIFELYVVIGRVEKKAFFRFFQRANLFDRGAHIHKT